ncbi:MAG: hypothetical protein WA919_17285 [Coleofasciculaceae cyanobacterium]
MTYADADQEFVIEGEQETPEYPTAFGVTITPKVGGIALGVLGLLLAGYLLMKVVQPTWQRYQELKADIADKKSQIQQEEEILKQIEEKKVQLAQAEQKNRQVLSLFANENTLDTLLLDLNNFVKDREGTLLKYQPKQEKPILVEDGSLGSQVNGKLKRQSIDLELEGRFEQIQSIMRSFERLQSLLLVKDFNAQLSAPSSVVIEQGRAVPLEQPTLKTSFTLEALMPLDEQEAAAEAAKQQPQQPPAQ